MKRRFNTVVRRFIQGGGTRRRASRWATPVALVIVLGCFLWTRTLADSHSPRQSVLRVLAWPGYADDDWVHAFEKRFHAKVEVTFVD